MSRERDPSSDPVSLPSEPESRRRTPRSSTVYLVLRQSCIPVLLLEPDPSVSRSRFSDVTRTVSGPSTGTRSSSVRGVDILPDCYLDRIPRQHFSVLGRVHFRSIFHDRLSVPRSLPLLIMYTPHPLTSFLTNSVHTPVPDLSVSPGTVMLKPRPTRDPKT